MSKPVEITILHTNDIHGHITAWTGWEGALTGKRIGGFDRLSAAVKRVRSQSKNTLLLDAGDTLGDTLPMVQSKGAAMVELMNAVGYDAMTLGNHEPDFGVDVLRQRMAAMRFPVLAANVIDKTAGRLFTRPYMVKTIDGVRVGILGLAYPNTPLTTAPKNVEGLEFRQAVETVREVLPRLRKEADVVVVLSHLGLNAEKKLAEQVPGIDVIVGGHSHNRVAEALRAGSTLVVQAGAHLSDLGRLDLTIDKGRILSHKRELILLEGDSDPATAALVKALAAGGEKGVASAGTLIARAQTIAGGQPEKRDKESPADSLFADLLRDETKTDLVLLPGVGYGVALQPGEVSESALRNLVPHESKIVLMELTGAQVLSILQQSVQNVTTNDPVRKVGGMIQVSGIRFAWSPSGVADVLVAGEALDPARTYRVATNSMLAQGGHRYAAFLEGRNRQELGTQFEMLVQALRKRGTVSPPAPGRIMSKE